MKDPINDDIFMNEKKTQQESRSDQHSEDIVNLISSSSNTMQYRVIHVLLVEDDLREAHLFIEYMRAYGGLVLKFKIAETLAEAFDFLRKETPDLILLDLSLPDSSGLSTVQKTVAFAPAVPIIVLTGHDNFNESLRAIDEGAQDYIVKSRADAEMLARAIRYALRRKEIETILRESEDQFRQFFENIPLYCYLVSEEGKILDINKSGLAALGYPKDEVIGQSINMIYAQESKELATKLAEKWRRIGFLKNEELTIVTKEGLKRTVLLNVGSVRNYDGSIMHSFSVQHDITERVIVERNLATERDRARFYLDIMGHDIRNKLQMIVNSIELVEMKSGDYHTIEQLRIASDSAFKCMEMISKVEKTEQLTSVPLQRTLLNEVLLLILSEFAKRNQDVTVVTEVSTQDMEILADEFLSDLLRALLDNALEHNPAKKKKVWITLTSTSDGYQLTIADNGVGISERRKEELFDMKRRFGGVGLHIARQIIDKYEGRIEVHDRLDAMPPLGVEFRVWFPKIT